MHEVVGAHNIKLQPTASPRLNFALGVSVMEAQLSNQQRTIFDAVHHAVLVRYAA